MPGGFEFEPGTYGAPGAFVPAISCLKPGDGGERRYHFILVRPDEVHADEAGALRTAERDLEAAWEQKARQGSDHAAAEHLRERGYLSVSDFRLAAD